MKFQTSPDVSAPSPDGVPKNYVHLSYKIRPVGTEGLGGFSPPNNLLKLADFVSKIGCKSQGHRNEDSNLYMFEEATRIYQKCNIF